MEADICSSSLGDDEQVAGSQGLSSRLMPHSRAVHARLITMRVSVGALRYLSHASLREKLYSHAELFWMVVFIRSKILKATVDSPNVQSRILSEKKRDGEHSPESEFCNSKSMSGRSGIDTQLSSVSLGCKMYL